MSEPSGLQKAALGQAKEGFYTLCRQYARMGSLIRILSKGITHPMFKQYSILSTVMVLIEQHHEIGEQLKVTGRLLDSVGGEPMMERRKHARPSDN